MGDLPFVAYFDFEITTGRGSKNSSDDEEIYSILYCFIFAFHPTLDIDCIVIARSFQHTLDQLHNTIYLKSEMID